jgi:hypothetical protein
MIKSANEKLFEEMTFRIYTLEQKVKYFENILNNLINSSTTVYNLSNSLASLLVNNEILTGSEITNEIIEMQKEQLEYQQERMKKINSELRTNALLNTKDYASC